MRPERLLKLQGVAKQGLSHQQAATTLLERSLVKADMCQICGAVQVTALLSRRPKSIGALPPGPLLALRRDESETDGEDCLMRPRLGDLDLVGTQTPMTNISQTWEGTSRQGGHCPLRRCLP